MFDRRFCGSVLVLFTLFLSTETRLYAQAGVEQAAQVLRLNREAVELFESLEFELAKKSLLEALTVGEKANLGNHVVMARTHGALGVVHGVGLKETDQAVFHFRKALEIKPDFKLPKELASPEATKLFARASKENKEGLPLSPSQPAPQAVAAPVASAGGAKDDDIKALLDNFGKAKPPAARAPDHDDPAAPPRPAPAVVSQPAAPVSAPVQKEPAELLAKSASFKCPTGGEVHAGDDVTLRCVTLSDLQPATVLLFYKRSGQQDFAAVPMRSSPSATNTSRATWVAMIPGREVTGSWLPFYFEARSPGGEALALSGRDDSPSILTVRRRADGPEEEPSLSARAKDDENPLVARKQEVPGRTPAGTIWIGMGVGSGAGWAAGKGVEAYQHYVRNFQAGVAPAGLAHVTPELGWFITSGIALSVQGRHQYIPRPDNITAGGAHALLARLLLFGAEGRHRFYGSLVAGGGEGFRLVVDAATTDMKIVKDTVRGGPVVAGAGGGYMLNLSPSWFLMLETNLLAGFPTFSAVMDVNLGLRAAF